VVISADTYHSFRGGGAVRKTYVGLVGSVDRKGVSIQEGAYFPSVGTYGSFRIRKDGWIDFGAGLSAKVLSVKVVGHVEPRSGKLTVLDKRYADVIDAKNYIWPNKPDPKIKTRTILGLI